MKNSDTRIVYEDVYVLCNEWGHVDGEREICVKNSDTRIVYEDVYVDGHHATIRRASARARHISTPLAGVVASRDVVAHARWRAPPAGEVRDGAFLIVYLARFADAADDDRATRGGAMCTRPGTRCAFRRSR